MLHVEKAQLLATNAQEIARFRATELQYYIEHLGSIQTIATLLAGFAFTAFLQMESVNIDVPTVLFRRWVGDYDLIETAAELPGGNSTSVDRRFVQFDELAIITFVVHGIEVFSVCLCLVEMISVLLETLLARLLGSRLALRGQDGSIAKATKSLAKSLLKSTSRFIVGLQWFLLSVVCHAACTMHPVISGVALLLIFVYWRGQFAM